MCRFYSIVMRCVTRCRVESSSSSVFFFSPHISFSSSFTPQSIEICFFDLNLQLTSCAHTEYMSSARSHSSACVCRLISVTLHRHVTIESPCCELCIHCQTYSMQLCVILCLWDLSQQMIRLIVEKKVINHQELHFNHFTLSLLEFWSWNFFWFDDIWMC